jgi:hypothetical protein
MVIPEEAATSDVRASPGHVAESSAMIRIASRVCWFNHMIDAIAHFALAGKVGFNLTSGSFQMTNFR